MNALETSQLVNLLGFSVGVGLYSLLLLMTLRHTAARFEWLLGSTAILGLAWNAGELLARVGIIGDAPFAQAIAHAAFGFLPAVVVHSTFAADSDAPKISRPFVFAAYGLSFAAAALHFFAAVRFDAAPSVLALRILTFGFLAILAALFIFAFRQSWARRTVSATALIVFAASAVHLSQTEHSESWFVEFIGHQASLPLALAILYQDFRFAFADLFLKRALSILMLAAAAFGLYVFIAAPLVQNANQTQAVGVTLILWMATALVYPLLHGAAVWLVDKILLRRVDYQKLRARVAVSIARRETPEAVLDELTGSLQTALTAREGVWHEVLAHDGDRHFPHVNTEKNAVEICVPTAEAQFYHVTLSCFTGGRRLLSDEISLLEDVALIAARRVDALRVSHERCEREIREREIGKLATEAELRALRAQINPHFLFNALTTIGYLINAAPDKASETLMQLTRLLRGVLRASGEFATLGEEIKLIQAYLEIEKARFEERLQVRIEIAPDLLKLRVPALILQPLVENAVKHGISAQKAGGEIEIAARLENRNLILTVSDTGAGVSPEKLIETRRRGVGLENVEARLRSHFGAAAKFEIESQAGTGTTAQITIPDSRFQIQDSELKAELGI